MLGDAILVAPAFEGKNEDKYSVYFPAGAWVNVHNYAEIFVSAG